MGEGGVFDAAIRVLAVVQDRKSYIDKFFVLTGVSKNGIITSHKINYVVLFMRRRKTMFHFEVPLTSAVSRRIRKGPNLVKKIKNMIAKSLYVAEKVMLVFASIAALTGVGAMIFSIIFLATELLSATGLGTVILNGLMIVLCSVMGYICLWMLTDAIKGVVRR